MIQARHRLSELFRSVRRATIALAEPLAPEDTVVQTMPDASPTKWHLAHTSWFFETFLLEKFSSDYRTPDERYAYLFNSYYDGVGAQFPRPERGRLSRPTLSEVLDYRRHIDGAMARLFEGASDEQIERHAFVIEVGINHEEQHQELIVTDVKTVLAHNPLCPRYVAAPPIAQGDVPALRFFSFDGGIHEIGARSDGFAYDNERPRHRAYLEPFELANRPVTAGEYLEFIRDGGYTRPSLWLSDGWANVQREAWKAPLYWNAEGEGSFSMSTLSGRRAIDVREPICHVSFYEADAFARWAGSRLPTEAEWEVAANDQPVSGNFLENAGFHPRPLLADRAAVMQLFGDVWEWTASPYVAYPGYRPFPGILAEYNGKFMSSQLVLRGGSCASPARHLRPSYRNFFPPHARWQFSGLRLAR